MRKMALSILMLFIATAAAEDAEKEAPEKEQAQRAGTCEEAKIQMKYWCEERAKVSVVVTGLECKNAKRNVTEACEGVKSEDREYK